MKALIILCLYSGQLSEIVSDHMRTIVWTIVWVPSDQKLSWFGTSDQRSFCLESLIRGYFGLESLIIPQFGSGLQLGILSETAI